MERLKPWLALVLIVVPLTGCLGGEGARGPPEGATEFDPDDDEGRVAYGQKANGTPPPRLDVGTAFTFDTTGIYDGEETVTAVVARADEGGFLMAGASPADLPTEIAWDRPWLGIMDLELNSERASGEGRHKLLDFPLYDGKTWSWGDSEVVARAADVPVLQGVEPGFRMEHQAGNWTSEWTYAPSIGFFTSFVEGTSSAYYEARLVRVGTSTAWTWYEPLQRWGTVPAASGAPASVTSFELPANADALAVSAGGTPGNTVYIQPPATEATGPWSFSSPAGQAWTTRLFDAAAGPWTAWTTEPEEGYAYAEMVAVAWIGPTRSDTAE